MKKWFKFYGQEYLSDPKMLSLTAVEKALWLTLLCLASASEEEGTVKYIDEWKIVTLTGIGPLDDEFDEQKGFLKKFEDLGMVKTEGKTIKITNFTKRQEMDATNAERQARYRAKKQKSNITSNGGVVTKVTLEKNRIDKNRIEKKEDKKERSLTYLKELSESDLNEFHDKYEADTDRIKKKAAQIVSYCESKGRTYKNYKSALHSWLLKDFGFRKSAIKPKYKTEFNPETNSYRQIPV